MATNPDILFQLLYSGELELYFTNIWSPATHNDKWLLLSGHRLCIALGGYVFCCRVMGALLENKTLFQRYTNLKTNIQTST